jgi:Terminase large subunit, T4likevirus-type, N-terminal
VPKKATKQLSLQRDLARACDPVLLAQDCGLDPDPVQIEILRSTSRRIIICASRQFGKSSITACAAIWACLYEAPARVVLVSPSMQQSTELFKKCMTYLEKLPGVPRATQSSLTRLELENGSRIISLPGSEKTVRGYSASLAVIDECARCSDELITAVQPMLAASENGRLVCLSTPFGRRGYFFEQFTHGEDWHRIQVKASECPRISPAFLKQQRAEMGELLYEQEFCCCFHDQNSSVFSSALLEACLTDEFDPFITD